MQEQVRRLLEEGHSIRNVARALGVSRQTVRKFGREAPQPVDDQGEPVDTPRDARVTAHPVWARCIDWQAVRAAVSAGATIKQLHAEWSPEVSYTRFRRMLHTRTVPVKAVAIRIVHEPGRTTQVDYCDGISLVDRATGEVVKTHLFCGVLPSSSYTFGEFVMNQKLASFIESHERMWSYFGGVSQYVVIDNLKSGVKRAHRYDPDVNPTYCDFGNHCGFAVLPARPYKPRDKACVEATIGAIQRGFFQEVRSRAFYSLSELNASFREYLERFNAAEMKDYGQSRKERFISERPTLRELPATRYELTEWCSCKVHPDCHIQVEKNFYSVPFSAIGNVVRVRKTARIVEIFDADHEPLAAHARVAGVGKFSTDERHYPGEKISATRFDVCVALRQAERIGPYTQEVVHRLVHGGHPLRYLRRVQGILRLTKSAALTEEALEYASGMALKFGRLRLGYIKSCAEHYQRNGQRPALVTPQRDLSEVFLHGQGGKA